MFRPHLLPIPWHFSSLLSLTDASKDPIIRSFQLCNSLPSTHNFSFPGSNNSPSVFPKALNVLVSLLRSQDYNNHVKPARPYIFRFRIKVKSPSVAVNFPLLSVFTFCTLARTHTRKQSMAHPCNNIKGVYENSRFSLFINLWPVS